MSGDGEAKGFSLNLLTKGPSQRLFVPAVKLFWSSVWKLMVNELAPHDSEGRFVRDYSKDSCVTQPYSSLRSDHEYRLYLGNPCPWCHRVFVALALMDMPNVKVTKLVANAAKASKGGWVLPGPPDECASEGDEPLPTDLAGIYSYFSGGEYKGRSTAPLLVDTTTSKLVSNESNDILLLLNSNSADIDLRPAELVNDIDKANDFYYRNLQNGVYRCGFSTSQKAYGEC